MFATQTRVAAQSRSSDLPMQRTCAVRLVDLRTGSLHRINGTPLTIFTRNPRAAVAELLAGRDPAIWQARIDELEAEPRK